MSKKSKNFVCTNCGNFFKKWAGQCPECYSWNSIEEEYDLSDDIKKIVKGNILPLNDLGGTIADHERILTPFSELNRVFGGGLVPGSAILIGGEPGIGKSTLLLQLASMLSDTSKEALYITGEESVEQVKLRALRLGLSNSTLKIVASTNVSDLITTMNSLKIKLAVIDSIQTMQLDDISSAAGTVSQIKASSHELINFAKKRNIILVLVGHVTKEGQIAGPKLLEHMVDTVLYFEGENHLSFKILRVVKNRYGPTGEIAVFEMGDKGLSEITNPSELFLMNRANNISGVSVFASIEGTKPVLVEIQALISPSNMAMPRRSVVGWDPNRLSMIIAVLAVRYKLNLSNFEAYLNIAGGLKISEPAADLPVALALISSATNRSLPNHTIAFGEIGLSGEIRKVSNFESRIKESIKLGFKNIILPTGLVKNKEAYEVNFTEVSHIIQLKELFT